MRNGIKRCIREAFRLEQARLGLLALAQIPAQATDDGLAMALEHLELEQDREERVVPAAGRAFVGDQLAGAHTGKQ